MGERGSGWVMSVGMWRRGGGGGMHVRPTSYPSASLLQARTFSSNFGGHSWEYVHTIADIEDLLGLG